MQTDTIQGLSDEQHNGKKRQMGNLDEGVSGGPHDDHS